MKIFLLVFFTGMLSCKTKHPDTPIPASKRSNLISDSVKVFVEKNHRGMVDVVYTFIKQEEKLLGFPSLEKGSDSLTLRIWFREEFSPAITVYTLKYENEKWEAEECNYKLYTDDSLRTLNLTFKEVNKVKPKHGWKAFLKNINIQALESLADTIPLKSNIAIMDEGFVYAVEISTKKVYIFKTRTITKWDEELQKNDILVPVIKLFDKEFYSREWN